LFKKKLYVFNFGGTHYLFCTIKRGSQNWRNHPGSIVRGGGGGGGKNFGSIFAHI